MPSAGATIAWWVPEAAGGVRAYAEGLHPDVRRACEAAGMRVEDIVAATDPASAFAALSRISPDVVHVQHEFGLFSRSVVPPFTGFPRVLRELRACLPSARIVATAHTVRAPGHRMGTRGHGPLGALARIGANLTFVPMADAAWGRRTWGGLDGVLVHSAVHEPVVAAAGCALVRVAPMYVPRPAHGAANRDAGEPVLLVFGYLHPAKGQDLAIEALAAMRSRARLVLAGGLRLERHARFARRCARRAETLGVADRVTVTGFVPDAEVGERFAHATLVLAPFRESTGSFTIARAFAQGAAVLASDLPVNCDAARGEPGAPALFRAGDAADCARRADELLGNAGVLAEMRAASLRQARARSLETVAARHAEFYRDVLSGPAADAPPANGRRRD